MNAAVVVQAIEGMTDRLIPGLNAELRTNLGTSHYHRLSDREFTERHSNILHGLMQWLLFRDEASLQKTGEALGTRRFSDGVPLGQLILVLIIFENFLWQFLDAADEPVDTHTRRTVTEFFQKFSYYAAKGYETLLAESNRLARSSPELPQPPVHQKDNGAEGEAARKSAEQYIEGDQEISRGGQVGEHGG